MNEHQRAIVEGRVVYDPGSDKWRDATSWRQVDLGAIKRGEATVAPPAFLARVDGEHLVYADRAHVFFGPPESLKSWAALLACKSVVDAGLTALYIDFEDDAVAFVERARFVSVVDGAIGRALQYMRPDVPLDQNAVARADLDMALADLRPALVVLDGVTEAYALHGWDVNKATDAARFTQVFTFPDGAAVIAIDHTGKDASRGIVGSLHKRAGIDGAAYEFAIKRNEGRGGTAEAAIKVDKDRHGHVRAFAHRGSVGRLLIEPGAGVRIEGTVDFATELARNAELEEAVVVFVREHPGCSKREVKYGVPGGHDDVEAALQRALLAGHVQNTGSPKRHSYQCR